MQTAAEQLSHKQMKKMKKIKCNWGRDIGVWEEREDSLDEVSMKWPCRVSPHQKDGQQEI